MLNARPALLALLAGSVLAACSALPRGAAIEGEIAREAAPATSGFAFYPVTRALLPAIDAWPAVNSETSHGWPDAPGGQGPSGQLIAAGDTLRALIWDSSENSLLTSLNERAAPLTDLEVAPNGRIFVPYVGEVRVAGMTPQRARLAIQNQLSAIAPSAQVQISLKTGRANSVDLVSGVANPGSYPLTDRGQSVLGMISLGGGVPPNLRNPRVKLQRGGKLYVTSVERLFANPRLDAVLTGGDKLIVEEDARYFLSLGAAGKEAIIPFTRDYVTALEAISMIGGLTDTRADPEGVLVLREYPRSALAPGHAGPREQRVVFSIDLTTADGLFSAKSMQIFPGDVVLATESPVSSLQIALGLVGSSFSVFRSLSSL
ncbi:polysaccharide biosynthesis/export family protein [Profundibacterium mesophilum]|uniref:Capsule polysaccharide exporter n=1 Tax=Profundibacterium mesophilum KAUST100406-0324 TaxID=1037889 RepID=A0A921NQI8_9RHOB|nr:polysaccharide biosynthesis/export family protein [Profundibacterium mesophilum]KAF0676971.1 putative capsule polysaccharide exporter [Profundibacterium mesophilum KAUST100406-0324]